MLRRLEEINIFKINIKFQIFKIFAADIKDKCEISAIACCAVTGEGLEKFFPQVLSAIQRSKK